MSTFVHEAVADALKATGTDTLFGLIGDANLFMVNAFVEKHRGTYVSAVHEAGAVMMASGYAIRRQGLGVATVTQGPGLTNTATALIEAVRSGTPLVVITGETAPSRPFALQWLDQEAFVRSTGAHPMRVERPEDAAAAVHRAAAFAIDHSIPVVVSVPTEFQWVQIQPTPPPDLLDPEPPPPVPDDVLDKAVGIVASVRQPLVLAGRGVVQPDGRAAVLAFACRIGAPIATTLRARNLYSADEGNVGVFGTLSTESGVHAMADCDCVIAFGASLNHWTTDRNALLRGKAVIHVDRAAQALNRHAQVTVAVRGDAAELAGTFIELLDTAEVSPTPFRARVCQSLTEGALHFGAPVQEGVTLARVLSAVNRAVPAQRTVVYDCGRFVGEALKYLEGGSYRSEVLTMSFGSVGLGMGAAIGAACAAREAPTVFVVGDGGFMMNGLAELHSAVRAGIPLIVIICNDRSYGAEFVQYAHKGISESLSLFRWPSFADVAAGLGVDVRTIDVVDDIDGALSAIAAPSRPLVIDVHVDPQTVPEVAH